MNERKREEKEESIDFIIKKMMRAWGLEGKMKELEIVEAWPELMGKGVANRTERIYIKNKVLHLKLNSSVIRDELLFGRTVIIQRVNQFAGSQIINDVWFE